MFNLLDIIVDIIGFFVDLWIMLSPQRKDK